MDLRDGDPRRIGHGRPSIEVHVQHRDQRHGEVDAPLLDVRDELAYYLATLGDELSVMPLDSGHVVVRVPADEVDRNTTESLADVDHARLLAHAVALPVLVLVALEDDDLVTKVVHAIRALASARERSIGGDVGGCSGQAHRVEVLHERGLLGETGHAEGLRVAALALVVAVEDIEQTTAGAGPLDQVLVALGLVLLAVLGHLVDSPKGGLLALRALGGRAKDHARCAVVVAMADLCAGLAVRSWCQFFRTLKRSRHLRPM